MEIEQAFSNDIRDNQLYEPYEEFKKYRRRNVSFLI